MGERPLARSKDLIIEELGSEIVVYDTKANRGHALNPDAARVWRSCDGRTSAEEITARLALEPSTVERALSELDYLELLEVPPKLAGDGSTRREATLKLAKVGAAAAAAPLVMTATASASTVPISPGVCATKTNCIDCRNTGCCWCLNAAGADVGCKANLSACQSAGGSSCAPNCFTD